MEMEELELLEESYRFNEEEEQFLDFQPPEPYPYESDGEQPSEAPPVFDAESPPFPEIPIDGHKRPRPSDGPDASGEKRSRIGEDIDEEEWLRYSPSKAAEERGGGDSIDAAPIVEAIEKEEEDKFVWRFASEIDGEFLPVTAPSGGDRVYAKVCRAREAEDRRGKYDARSLSEGLC